MTRDRSAGIPRWTSILAAMALVCAPLQAGVVYETETTDPQDPKAAAVKTQMSIEGTNIRIQFPSGKGMSEVIYRGDRREMLILDLAKKSYAAIDPQRVADMMAALPGATKPGAGGNDQADTGMDEAMKQLEEQMAGMSEEDRKLLESAVKGSVAKGAAPPKRAATTVRATGESAAQGDYACKRYDVQRGEEKLRELCVTAWDRIEGGMEAKAAFLSFGDFHKALMAVVEKGAGPLMDMMRVEGGVEDLFKIGGFPVKTVAFEGGKAKSETVLTSASSATLPKVIFEAPADYSPMTLGK